MIEFLKRLFLNPERKEKGQTANDLLESVNGRMKEIIHEPWPDLRQPRAGYNGSTGRRAERIRMAQARQMREQ